MNGRSSKKNGGIGVTGALGIMFVAFKLLGIIDWSWWWVTLPFWGTFAIAVIGFLVITVFILLFERKK